MAKPTDRFQPEGQCYVLPMGVGFCSILRKVRENHIGACYPERGMSRLEIMTSKPFLPSIVTEEPFLVALYDRESVFMWDKEAQYWRNPNIQTYGSDISWITQMMFGNRSQIPYQVLGGDEASQKLRNEIKDRYSTLK